MLMLLQPFSNERGGGALQSSPVSYSVKECNSKVIKTWKKYGRMQKKKCIKYFMTRYGAIHHAHKYHYSCKHSIQFEKTDGTANFFMVGTFRG